MNFLYLNLNRDPDSGYGARKERSYFTYGQVVYQAGAVYLRGRLHIDMKNSFLFKETGLDGLIELARIANLPLQKIARTSPGTAISNIEVVLGHPAPDRVSDLRKKLRTDPSLPQRDHQRKHRL